MELLARMFAIMNVGQKLDIFIDNPASRHDSHVFAVSGFKKALFNGSFFPQVSDCSLNNQNDRDEIVSISPFLIGIRFSCTEVFFQD